MIGRKLYSTELTNAISQRETFDFACRLNWSVPLLGLVWMLCNRAYLALSLFAAGVIALIWIDGLRNLEFLNPAVGIIFFWLTLIVSICLRVLVVVLAVRANSIVVRNCLKASKTHDEFQFAIAREKWKQRTFLCLGILLYLYMRTILLWTSFLWSGIGGWYAEITLILDGVTFIVLFILAVGMRVRRKRVLANSGLMPQKDDISNQEKHSFRKELQTFELCLYKGLLTLPIKALLSLFLMLALSVTIFVTTAFLIHVSSSRLQSRMTEHFGLMYEIGAASGQGQILLDDFADELSQDRIDASTEIGLSLNRFEKYVLSFNSSWLKIDSEVTDMRARRVFLFWHGRMVGAFVEVHNESSIEIISLSDARNLPGVVTLEEHFRKMNVDLGASLDY